MFAVTYDLIEGRIVIHGTESGVQVRVEHLM